MPLFNPRNLVQVQSINLTSNITKGNGGTTTILTLSITTQGGNIISMATVNSSNSSTTAVNLFDIQLDGTTIARAGSGNDGGLVSGANVQKNCLLLARSTSVSAGSHTITLQWGRTAGTARINASSGTNNESANLTIIETLV